MDGHRRADSGTDCRRLHECVQPGSGYTDGPCNNEGGGNNGGNGGNGGSGGGGGEKVFDATLGWAGLEPYPLQSSIGTLIVGNMETCYTVGPTFAATNAAVWGANPPGEPGSFPLIAAGSFVYHAPNIAEGSHIMRGHDEQTHHMFSDLSPEQRVPADHPLRAVRALTDHALKTMSRRFAGLYAKTGRPSTPGSICRSHSTDFFSSLLVVSPATYGRIRMGSA